MDATLFIFPDRAPTRTKSSRKAVCIAFAAHLTLHVKWAKTARYPSARIYCENCNARASAWHPLRNNHEAADVSLMLHKLAEFHMKGVHNQPNFTGEIEVCTGPTYA